jgi:hypothetical protein
MKMYVMWQKNAKNVAIMDITKMVEDTMKEQPELQRMVVANAIMDLAEADCIMTADSEEQMLEMFPNAEVRYERDHDKEVH